MINSITVAGKNSIAIDVVDYIRQTYPSLTIRCITNKTDNSEDTFQRSFKRYITMSSLTEVTLQEAYGIENSMFLSLEFDRIVVPDKFKSDQLFNIHFSMLPKYKGMFTSAWPLLNGEKVSGVTLHEIDAGIDTGNIIAQQEFSLEHNETAKTLYNKYITAGTELVINNLERLINRDYKSEAQGSHGASYYSKSSIDYSALPIDLNKTANEIKNQFNAFTFRDYQLPKFQGESIFGIEITETKSSEKAGTIVEECLNYFCVATIDYDCIFYKDMFSEFLSACEKGDLELVRSMSVNDYLINEKNHKGWSPIIVAAYHGQIDIIKHLISKGANINDTNYNGTSVLMYAKNYLEKSGDVEYIKQLLSLGADQSLKDNKGLCISDYINMSGNEHSLSVFGKYND